MASMAERLLQAWNARDVRRVVALFADDYRSHQPLHPGRTFTGSSQVRSNWIGVFKGVPDFTAELIDSSIERDTEWAEWHWRGRYRDHSPFEMRGVTIMVIRDSLIASARLYMEPVETMAEDIDAAVHQLYRPADRPQ